MATKQSSRSGNIRKFELHQAKNNGTTIDISGSVTEIKYYEDILSNSVSLSAIIAETGETDDDNIGNKGILDGLPVRGGEPSTIHLEDHDGTSLNFKGDSKLYVNRVRNVISGTSKDVYVLDFVPRELFANEQCRVVKRYDGKISENIKNILEKDTSKSAGIKTKKKLNIDETNLEYNFIGNDRKPFYVCTWLASKAVPAKAGKLGGIAGFLFYETYKGYNFRSIDVLFDTKPFSITKPFGSYVMENVLFKISYPAEFHAQTAVEAAMILHEVVKDRLDQIDKVVIETQEPGVRIIDKTGPLNNPADRDHCIQYMVAIPMIFGRLTAKDYEDEVAADARIDELRRKMVVRENENFTKDYFDPDKRYIGNAIEVFFKDGSRTERVAVDYPIGHKQRRHEGIPTLICKFDSSISGKLKEKQWRGLKEASNDPEIMRNMSVDDFMALLVV